MPLDRSLPDEPREALKMLWSVAEDQQVDINRHRDSLHKVWHVAPAKPREGMLVYADGTDWNPGSGAGYYVYYAGAWHPMSGGGGGGGGYTIVQDEGVALPVQSTLNFVGAGVTATNDAGSSRTLITIPGGGGSGVVTSVFTRIGDVIAASGDYTAAQVTNAVSILGSYANPGWITSLAYSKLTGVPTTFTPAAHVHAAADVTTGVMAVARLGTGTPSASNWLRGDGAWTALPASAVTSVFTRTGAVIAASGDYTAAQVTNAVSILGSYADPAWITSLAYSKLTGVPSSFTPAAHVHAAADTTSGVFAVARLGTGTPSSANFLRGDGAWTVIPGGGVTSVFTRTGAVVAVAGDYTAAQVTNAVSTIGSYADPAWVTSLAYAKITGAPTIASIQTPWLQNINGGAFDLTNVKTINYQGGLIKAGAPGTTTLQMQDGTPNHTSSISVDSGAMRIHDNAGAIEFSANTNGGTVNQLYLNTNGYVGIGGVPTYQLQLSTDSAAKSATSTWTVWSDARLKKNIRDLVGGLDVIEKLRPVAAEFNGLGGTKDGERVVGFIAQELQAILPGTVSATPGKLGEEETDVLGVNIHECLMHAILAIKQLKAKVEALELAAATP